MAKGIVWNAAKIDFLKENYLCMTDGQLSRCLQCAESTINKKIQDLNLTRPSYYKSPLLPVIHLFFKWDRDRMLDVPDPETPLYKKIKKKVNGNNSKLNLRKVKYEDLAN